MKASPWKLISGSVSVYPETTGRSDQTGTLRQQKIREGITNYWMKMWVRRTMTVTAWSRN